MKRLFTIIFSILVCGDSFAQEVKTPQLQPIADSLPVDTLVEMGADAECSLPLSPMPFTTRWGLDTWRLHQGLNVNLGASVFASFGKHAPKGVGFTQDLSLMYAMPIGKRMTLSLGGWLNNVNWSHSNYTDAGLSATLGYKFDEHWEAYAYARKSLMNNHAPYPYMTMGELGDRIGAAVKYNFSPSFSIQLSVESVKYKSPFYFDRCDNDRNRLSQW